MDINTLLRIMKAAQESLETAEAFLTLAYEETDALLADDIHEARYNAENTSDLVGHIIRKIDEDFYLEVEQDETG